MNFIIYYLLSYQNFVSFILFIYMIRRTNSFQIQNQNDSPYKNTNKINNNGTGIIVEKPNDSENKMIQNRNSHQAIYEQEQRDQVKSMKIAVKDISINKKTPAMTASRNMKMPESIKQSIKKLASGKRPAEGLAQSKIAKSLRNSIHQKIKGQIFICNICACQYEIKQKKRIGKCQHQFCDSCLRHYIDYKIARFQQVLCPAENCTSNLDVNGEFYQTLSPQQKQKYNKVSTFALAMKSNSRLCPDEKCKEGFLIIEQGSPPKCNKCQKIYCKQCFFPKHEGLCDKNQIDFFQNNLHYRQCTNCKAIVQRTQGCNHMTCRCSYHFCYLCGGKWTGYDHKCGTSVQPAQQGTECCQCTHGQGCFPTFLRVLIKIIIFLPIFLVVMAIYLGLMLIAFILIIMLTITVGIFPCTCQFICEDLSGICSIIAFILYPLSMCVGLFKAFSDFFCRMLPDVVGGICQKIADSYQVLLGW